MASNSWESAAETHPGKVRSRNEDHYFSGDEDGVWVVADGMGGHSAGDVASQMVCDEIREIDLPSDLEAAITQVREAIVRVNHRLQTIRQRDPLERVMGSTVTVMVARAEKMAVLWAGDSRIYRLRDGELARLTEDHSRVAELVSAGQLSEEEAESHPEANVITRAVGAHTEIDVDAKILEAQPGDRFVLCSDGLYREITEDQLAEAMAPTSSVGDASGKLLEMVLDGEARDNVTLVTVAYSG